MNHEEHKKELDAWLNQLSEWEIRKIRQIAVSALQKQQKLSGNNTFKIPFHLFIAARITDKEKQAAILTNLHSRKVIDVSRAVNTPTPLYDSNGQPILSKRETISNNPDIINDSETTVTLLQGFDYLAKRLDELVRQYEASKKSPQQLPQEKIEWQNDFHWEGNNFIFGEYGSISFNSTERKALFKKLTDKKGGWVKVTELRGDKNDDYVRATISQIEKRIRSKFGKFLSIPSTKDDNASGKPEGQGAYRIKFIPKP